jgi:hypothetical protein
VRNVPAHDETVMDELEEILKADARALTEEAPLPSAAVVWWRAQAQARREALDQVSRPISVVQGIAVACAGGLTATAAGLYVPTFRRALEWVMTRTGGWSGLSLPAEPLTHPLVVALILATAIGAVFTPLALYFTLRED